MGQIKRGRLTQIAGLFLYIGLKLGAKTLQFDRRTSVVKKNLSIRMYKFKYT